MNELPADMREQLKRCAHDLNNVLGQVLGFSSLLVRDISDANAAGKLPPGVLDYAQELLAAGLRGEAIAKQLTAIVRAMPAGTPASPTASQPVAPPAPTPAPAPASTMPAAPERSTRRLLIAGIGDAVSDPRAVAFVEIGWQVETHRSGADALRRFRGSSSPFDAVIAYPGADEIPGTDLIAAIKALRPATVCLLVLADGSDDSAARLAGADGGVVASSTGASAVAIVDGILRQRRSAA